VDFPSFENKIAEGITLVSSFDIDSAKAGDEDLMMQQKHLITAFDSGLYYIPPYPFVIHGKGNPDTIFSSPNYLEVHSVPIDTTGTIRDIKDIYKAPVSFGEVYPYILLIVLITLVTGSLIYYFRRRKQNKPVFKREKPPEPAHILALRDLDRLNAQKLWQQQKTKEYYSRLSVIIRTYIERRFGIMAMEQTTIEILDDFHRWFSDEDINYDILSKLLGLADLVKFAKEEPLPDENLTHMDNAYNFVKCTMISESSGQDMKPERKGENSRGISGDSDQKRAAFPESFEKGTELSDNQKSM